MLRSFAPLARSVPRDVSQGGNSLHPVVCFPLSPLFVNYGSWHLVFLCVFKSPLEMSLSPRTDQLVDRNQPNGPGVPLPQVRPRSAVNASSPRLMDPTVQEVISLKLCLDEGAPMYDSRSPTQRSSRLTALLKFTKIYSHREERFWGGIGNDWHLHQSQLVTGCDHYDFSH